jgi:hypothetical protein
VGFAVTAMPVLSHFAHHPGSFNSRINQVSVFQSGWLDSEVEIRGEHPLRILAGQFYDAALVPFGGRFTGTILHPDPPLLAWPLVIPAALGLVIATLTFWRRPHFGLVVTFWATVAGMAITIGPSEPHKLVTAIPVIVILAAAGIMAVANLLANLIKAPGMLVRALVASAVIGVVIWNLNFYFADPDRDDVYSDPTTQIAQSLAERAVALGNDTTVYLLGAPWMTYNGYSNLQFIARDVTGIDLVEPLTTATPPPEITGPTLFAVLAGREDELAVVRSWFPNGVEARHAWEHWGYLYSTYTVYPQVIDELAGDGP